MYRSATKDRRGFTLVELLTVIVVLGVMATMVLPSLRTGIRQNLKQTVELMATDLAYARDLAVMYNSDYLVQFELDTNSYVLTHSGANTALDQLPLSPLGQNWNNRQRHEVDLDELPGVVAARIELYWVRLLDTSTSAGNQVEFMPLGCTTADFPTEIWLRAVGSNEVYYCPLRVDPVTGIIWPGTLQTEDPRGS